MTGGQCSLSFYGVLGRSRKQGRVWQTRFGVVLREGRRGGTDRLPAQDRRPVGLRHHRNHLCGPRRGLSLTHLPPFPRVLLGCVFGVLLDILDTEDKLPAKLRDIDLWHIFRATQALYEG